jgi:hypothetical protein
MQVVVGDQHEFDYRVVAESGEAIMDNKKPARIHAMKKEAGITGEDYRSLLSGAAGVDSAKDIPSQAGYNRVIRALSNLLAAQSSGRHPANYFLEKAVYARAKRVPGPKWRGRLAGYLKRPGKTKPAECGERELRQIMGFFSKPEKTEYSWQKASCST